MKNKSTRLRRIDAMETLRSLAKKIDKAMLLAAKSQSRRCLVELESASKDARRLLRLVSKSNPKKRINWNALIEAIAFISGVVKKLYSLFNCYQFYRIIYEYWSFN